jgi:hypothetical protein
VECRPCPPLAPDLHRRQPPSIWPATPCHAFAVRQPHVPVGTHPTSCVCGPLRCGRDPFKGSRSPAVIMSQTCRHMPSKITRSRTLARIRHTGGRSGPRRSTVIVALTPSSRTGQSARPGCLLLPRSRLHADFLVVSVGSRGPNALRSDGVAALDAADAAWTIEAEETVSIAQTA